MAGGKADTFPPVVVIYILFLIFISKLQVDFSGRFHSESFTTQKLFLCLEFLHCGVWAVNSGFIFGGLVPCPYGHIPGTFLYVCKGYSYGIFAFCTFQIFLNRVFLTCGGFVFVSQQDFITCGIFAFCVSDSHSVSFYSDIPDLWLLWCNNSDLDLLDLCPGTIDFIALYIQNPASGCHIPGTFCQISERCLWLAG